MVDLPFGSPSSWFDEYIQQLTLEDRRYQQHETLLHECAATDFLSPHRQDWSQFNHLSADAQAAEAIEDDNESSMQAIDYDMDELSAHLPYQSDVVPHVPNLHLSESVMETRGSQQCSLSPPHSPNYSSGKQTRKFQSSDPATGKARPPRLHEFMHAILDDEKYAHIVQYVDLEQGVFKIHKPERIAHLWKDAKGRNSDNEMTYDKVARALRGYYAREVIKPCNGRFTYRFGPASGFGTTWWPAC